MPKKIFSLIFIFFIFLFLYFVSALHDFFCTSLVKKGVTTAIKVHPGQSAHIFVQTLYEKKIIRHPAVFQWLINISGARFKLRYGEYDIHYPLTAWNLLQNVKHGTGLLQHRLTIVNGWTFSQVLTTLRNDANLKQTMQGETNQQILQRLKATESHPEGLFYPNTYFFTWGNSDISILRTAYQKMQTLLQTDWKNRALNLPYQNAYQALIVASLIEKETSVDSEKPLIASVIMNRLAKHMRLQIDPTVQYGLNKAFGGSITKEELATKTPYNTYLIDGLPPTPICIPSQSSILAALHPATTDYLYYVATGKGGHNFSKTYAEHEEQVAEYRSVMRDKSGKM